MEKNEILENLSVIKLPEGQNNYAILWPDNITYLLDATKSDIEKEKIKIKEKMNKMVKPNHSAKERSSLAIIPTFDCNLRCIYCYSNGGKTQEVISLQTVKKTLEYIKSQERLDILDLYLVGGGEPLLYFDLVCSIVNSAKDIFEKVQIHVVTNGTFNEEVLNWLIDESASIRVSFDSTSNSLHRPCSGGNDFTSITVSNIKSLVEANMDPLIQCIVTSKSVKKMREIIDQMVDLGIGVIKIEPALITQVSRGENSLQPDPKIFADNLLDAIEYIANNDLPVLVDTGFFQNQVMGIIVGWQAEILH